MSDPFIPRKSRLEVLLTFIADTKYVWAIGFVSLILLVVTGYMNLPEIPMSNTMKAGVIVFIVMSVIAYIPTKKVLHMFYEPDYEFLAEVDAASPKPIQIYATSKDGMNQLNLTSGATYTYRSAGGYLVHIVRSVDTENWTAEGTWLGEATDVELINDREKIDANRRKNRKWAIIGQKLFARFSAIADSVESKYFTELSKTEMELSSFKPDVLLDELEDNIDEFDIDDIDELEDIAQEFNGTDETTGVQPEEQGTQVNESGE
ncbi:hypothetical protein HTZ84_21165 [Haloterrigena sp. SYSU A558-1]|uniref:Uncharacterized protein n=1 Tax=Haloterrigena gelatinilytica TaxID=2741724 RepID=A0ABX2LPF3_9EURY|nr:hypothetical protein [Haloterrigena gelatinilytica]NUC74776.1 hypothetical protein [Haloterrigena gelatinilytica]